MKKPKLIKKESLNISNAGATSMTKNKQWAIEFLYWVDGQSWNLITGNQAANYIKSLGE